MAWDKTVPNAANDVADDVTALRGNMEWIERVFFQLGLLMLDDYEVDFTYTTGNLTGISVKNSVAAEVGSCVLVYSGDELQTETWTINGQTLTYTYTYSGGDLTNISLNIT